MRNKFSTTLYHLHICREHKDVLYKYTALLEDKFALGAQIVTPTVNEESENLVEVKLSFMHPALYQPFYNVIYLSQGYTAISAARVA